MNKIHVRIGRTRFFHNANEAKLDGDVIDASRFPVSQVTRVEWCHRLQDPRLRKLILTRNQVDHVWCKEILAQLSGHPALESLSLDATELSYLSLVEFVLPLLRTLPALQELAIGENTFTNDSVHQLCETLSCVSNLRILNMKQIKLSDPSVVHSLCLSLKAVHGLEELHLGETALTVESFSRLSPWLSSTQSLRLLDLTRAIGGAFADICREDFLSALFKDLTGNHSLQVLRLAGCVMGPSGAALAASVLQNLPLVELNLQDNGLCTEGCQIICKALTGHSSLESLDLSDNRLTSSATDSILQVVSSALQLQVLILDENDLGEEFTARLTPALGGRLEIPAAALLSTLSLSANHLTDAAWLPLAEFIRDYDAVENLALAGNGFCDGLVAKEFATAVAGSRILHTLDLAANDFGQQMQSSLTLAAWRSPVLRTLRMDTSDQPQYLCDMLLLNEEMNLTALWELLEDRVVEKSSTWFSVLKEVVEVLQDHLTLQKRHLVPPNLVDVVS